MNNIWEVVTMGLVLGAALAFIIFMAVIATGAGLYVLDMIGIVSDCKE